MIELLLDEAELGSNFVHTWQVFEVLHFRADVLIWDNTEFEAYRAYHQDGDVVQHHRQEGSPEEDQCPGMCELAIDQNGSIINLKDFQQIELLEWVAALASIDVGTGQLEE